MSAAKPTKHAKARAAAPAPAPGKAPRGRPAPAPGGPQGQPGQPGAATTPAARAGRASPELPRGNGAAPRRAAKSTGAGKAPRAAPPPGKRQHRGEPPGGVLTWTQHGSDTWLAPDPEGKHAGGRIKMSTQGWLGKSDPLYSVYRDAEYLGSDPTLEAAMRRCQWRERSARRFAESGATPGLPAFLDNSAEEREKTRDRGPAKPTVAWAGPKKVDAESAKAAEVRASLVSERAEAQGEKKAARRAAKESASLPDDAVIKMLVDKNPRKPGTGAHERFKALMDHDGKTVAQYKAAGGNVETLENAISAKRASISTGEGE